MSLIVIATLTPRLRERDEILSILKEMIPRVHAEDAGCELYSLHVEGDTFVLVEKWTDRAALDAHLQSAATREMSDRMDDRLAVAPAVRFLEPVPVGDPDLGQV